MPNWYDITRDPEYQSLPEAERIDLKRTFFNETIGKDPEFAALDDVTKRATWTEFMQSPDDTGEGFVRSTFGSAVRGAGEIVPGTLEGVGALTGLDVVRSAGKSVREGLEYIAPVNPIYEEGIPAKLANVGGNVASIIGTSGVGGLAGKALGAERAAAAGSAAARQALTNQAIQTGAKSALYGTGFSQGAAAKADENERLGITGVGGYMNLLGGGISELAPELLPFGSALETAAARRLLGGVDDAAGKVIPGIRMSAAQEAAEGGSTQVLSNLSTQLTAPTGVETPGLFEGAGEAAIWEGVGGAMFGAINKIGRPTPRESQTPIQQSMAAEANAIPVDEVPQQTEEEKRAGMEAGNPIIVDPQGNTAVVAPEAWNEAMKRQITPAAEQTVTQPSEVESRLTDWMQNPGLAAAIQTADNLVTTAVDVSPDVSKAAEAALEVIQSVAETPSPAMEMPEIQPQPIETTPDATLQREIPENRIEERLQAGEGRQTAETSGGNRPVEGGEIQEAVAPKPSDESMFSDERMAEIIAQEEADRQAMYELNGFDKTVPANKLEKVVGELNDLILDQDDNSVPIKDLVKRMVDNGATLQIKGKRTVLRSPDGFEISKSTMGETGLKYTKFLLEQKAPVSPLAEGIERNRATIARAAEINRGAKKAVPSTNEFVQKMTGQQSSPQGAVPTPATEGKVMPGGSATERDVTKPEQMTPEEALRVLEERIGPNDPKHPDYSRPDWLEIESRVEEGENLDEVLIDSAKGYLKIEQEREAEEAAAIEATRSSPDKEYVRAQAKMSPDQFDREVTLPELKRRNSGKKIAKDAEILKRLKAMRGDGDYFHAKSISEAIDARLPVNVEAVDTYGITLPEGYVKQGDLYIFQPPSEQSDLGAGAATVRETDEQRFQRIKALKPSQRSDDDIAFANEFSKRQKELKPQAGESTRKAFLANHTASIGGRLRKALDQGMNFRGLKGTVGSWVENLYNEGWRMALDARGNRQFTNGTEALGSSGLGKVGMNYADFLSSQPQTKQAAETQTPVPLREGTGAAGVVQSEPAEGSIPAVKPESPVTAIESTEKTDVAPTTNELARRLDKLIAGNATTAELDAFVAKLSDEQLNGLIASEMYDVDPAKLTIKPGDSRMAIKNKRRTFVDSVGSGIRVPQQTADKIFREEENALKHQRMREELALKTLNSLIEKTRTNVVQGAVKPADAQQAISILNRSGEIPNVLFTWIGTSKDFLADPANKARYPETWKAVSANSNIEGMSENGQPIVFTDNVGVSDLDRKLANLRGTTPEVAAVRRVILHENIHKGMFFLSLKEKMKLFQFLHRLYSPEELDALAKSYDEYADWRTNQVSYFSIIEEAMTRDFDSMVEIPRDGIWAEFMQFLREIWQKITGKTSEPKLKDYKDVFRLIRNSLKNSEKVNADRLKNGGAVRMSMGEFISNVTPEQDAAYMAAVEAGDMETASPDIRFSYAGIESLVPLDEAIQKIESFAEDNEDTGSWPDDVTQRFEESEYYQAIENNDAVKAWELASDNIRDAELLPLVEIAKKANQYGQAWDEASEKLRKAGKYSIENVELELEKTLPADVIEASNADLSKLEEWLSSDEVLIDAKRPFIEEAGNRIDATIKRIEDTGRYTWDGSKFEPIYDTDVSVRFSKVEYDSPNEAAFNSGAEVARNTNYDERDKAVRSAIRAAYDLAPKPNGPSVPLDQLYDLAKQSMPDLTEAEFSQILQDLYEDSGALLQAGESPFIVTTQDGQRAGSAIIMPPADMTKDDVTAMLRGMSAANPSPENEINQELYVTVLARLRDFISNGGRIPLPIQSYGDNKAGGYNYTGQKAGLERDLRQGSGIGGPGQIDTGTPFQDKLEGANIEIQRVQSEVSRNSEAITEGGENRKREAGARPNVGMAGGGYTFADYAQIASRIGARVQEVSNDIGGGLAVVADGNGATTILINSAQLGKRVAGISFGLDEDGALETIGNALVEELIHAADLAIQREAWIASGRRKPFAEFAIDSDKAMLDEMRKVVASSNDSVKATQILFDAIQASRQLYEAGATPRDIDELFSSPKGNISAVMSEFVRQMIQQDMHQTVSEASLFRRFIEHVMRVLQKIRDAIAPAKAGEFGDILKNRINDTEMMLALAYQQTGSKASKVDPESPASKEFAKDINEIESGSLKAAFAGRQFKDFKPIDRTVKPAKSYQDAAIGYVNNLEKEGASLEEIANSVISPAFLESIGIEQDLMAQDALGIEVRNRVNNAYRKEKNPVEKRRLQKLDQRMSAFWQGVGSKKGAHLGQRSYLVSSPRYSWMFMRDAVEKAMKERRDNILIAQFGENNATDFTQNSYENADTAKTASVNENVDKVEMSQDDIDLEFGETILDGEQKTLWERTKDWIRELGIAMRHLAAMDGEAKKSVSDGQRNAISRMSRDEVIAFIEDRKKKISEALKQILGDEAGTNSPVDKMVKIAKKRANKGLTLESLDSDSALAKMLREINKARRGAEVPLKNPIPWRKLLSQDASTVEEYRQRIFESISANEELKAATPEQKARLADLFSEAWESNRKRILDSMLERMIREQEAKKNLSEKGAKALQEQRMRIVEDINLGIFDNDEIAKIMAEKFGIKSEFTDAEREKIESLVEVLQDESLNRVKRNKAAYELLETLSAQTDIPIAKLLANFWVSSVLSGMNTVFSIGMSVFSGMGELTTALSRIFIASFSNPKQLPSELAAAFKSLARVLSAVPRQANRAWQYLVTGDQAFLDPTMNDALKNMDWDSIGKNNQLAEQMAKSDKILEKSMGLFMRTVSRLLTALDLFNSGLTKEGSLPIVFRQLELGPEAIAMLERRSDLKPYKDEVINKYFGNVAPKTAREKALVDSYAIAEMMKALDEIGNVSENADQMAMQGAMTLDPSGVGGYGYRAVKSLMKSAETGADKLLERNLRKWDEAKTVSDKTEAFVKLGLSYLFQFAAYNAANLVGVRFARFAGNKFNQSLSFLPVLGALRLFEAEFDADRVRGKEAFVDMIKRNQITGVFAAILGYYALKAIADEPDDEERGWFINGGWSNLTPEKKQQKLAAGEKEYTIGMGGKVFNYANWPGSGIIAAIGSLSDLIRFSPEQWNDKTVPNKLLSATTSGVFSALEVPALSQFQELFGSSLSSKDPNEQKLTKFARVLGNYAGGFMPRILKDLDYLADPNFRKYETLWEKTASHIPVYRRYAGQEYYDILGQQIQRNIYPGSREFMTKPTDPAYKILGALNSRGIWLTPANAEHRMVGKGARRRKLTQEEADNYGLETGKGYKQMLLRYGQRALQMPTERARDFLLEKANDVRDKALKKVYRGYTPAN